MSHVDPEVLALIALGEEAGTPDALAHLAQCPHCTGELRALASVVHLARQAPDTDGLVSPPAALWSRIAAHPDVQAGPGPVRATDDQPEPGPGARAAGSGRGWRAWLRRPAAVAAVGVLAGLIIGVGGAAVANPGSRGPRLPTRWEAARCARWPSSRGGRRPAAGPSWNAAQLACSCA